MAFDLDPDYVDVAARIREFREKHPEGSLQQVSYEFRQVDGASGWVYTAAAYRTPDDPRPGQGTAWEPFPGKTPYTRGSELQNAETAAWGRAIVAALAADTKKVASADEVRNRRADQEQPLAPTGSPLGEVVNKLRATAKNRTRDRPPEDIDQYIQAALDARGLDKRSAADLYRLLDEWEPSR